MFGKHSHRHFGGWSMAGPSEGGGKGGGRHGRGGPFGRHRGGPFGGRGPRMFDPGALRLVVLGLIGEEPRSGYDIIKSLEAKFQGAYSPSPGAIYPMLQMLEEADLVTSRAEGNKRLFSITEGGTAYLAEHAAELKTISDQIEEASSQAGGVGLGEDMRALRWAVFSKMRSGGLSADQARTARDILRRALQEFEAL